MDASVVTPWSHPSIVTLGVPLKVFVSYEILHTSVVTSVVTLFKSQGIIKKWVSCVLGFLCACLRSLRCPNHVDES